MKILHVANFSEGKFGDALYSTDRKISNGLIRNGHYVYNFSYRDVARSLNLFHSSKYGRQSMVKAFLKTIESVEPQLLLLGHSELLRPQDLVAARKQNPHMKIAMWWVDDPFPADRIALLKERMGVIDVLFTTVGVDPVIKALGDRKKTVVAYFPNIIDKTVEIGRAFDVSQHIHDLIFIGHATPERRFMLQTLSSLSHQFNIGMYGGSKDTKIFGKNYINKLSNSRMGLNFSCYNDVSLYSSDRLAHLVGNGLLTFTPQVPDLDLLFSDDEVVYFTDLDDLVVKVTSFHNDWEKGRLHAQRGYEKAHTSYNECRVTRFFLETIFEEPFTEQYEWQDQVVS
ncbi:glycosyltransferase family 1 protein [Desulfobulbus rhabdoformis]|uniref:glycosyltransferase family protein n=1 Tax=Desulfobulbus rhabdoformis TaxID=34032 RepID=UPI0019635F1E|nr:glycosyltransferase [Desulfobulbus rhabdoformis]MBM9613256.1 glycosyltransferase family 1 protein [Desulfobulbus rhabdoformis]